MKKLLRLISVATMLLAATTFMACSSDDDDDSSGARSVSARNSGSVVGVVLDNKGAPVDGATVTLGGKSVTTNKGGEFEITGVNPNDKSLITARKSNTTTSTATDGADGGSLKTESAETALSSTTSSVADGETAYKLTVTKDGYLPGTITGVYVTYTETEEQEVTRANALLHGLQYDYQDVLKAYAATLSNATATGSTATTTTTATEDTTATTTVQTGSNADRVFKDVSEAISALKNMYKTGSYTEYFSTFGTSTGLIPLDASFKGSLKLNLTSNEGTTWAEATLKPTSKPTIHVSYTSAAGADYTWATQADENGIFVFKESLPSGVELKISVDSFQETIKEGEVSTDYWFSSDSMIVLVDNSGAETTSNGTTTVNTVTLGSKDANHETFRFLLFAQNDKLWVTATNVEPTASGVLLTKNDPLTFTFNKPMKKVDLDLATGKTSGFKNLSKDAYDATFSEDKKTVTFTPKIGYWDLDGASQKVVLTAEATDGTTALYKDTFTVYFDNKVWVSVKDLSFGDYNDYRKLSDPIVLVFSKPMDEKIAVTLTTTNTAYTETWNEDKTELTLTPDTKVGYWDITDTSLDVQINDNYANSKDSHIVVFDYWKTGATANSSTTSGTTTTVTPGKITVYFDNYNDVTIAKADKGFTVTFDKPIKAQTESELKKNLNVYNVGTAYAVEDKQDDADAGKGLADVVLALSDDGKTITVTPQNTEFATYGYYSLVFAKDKFVAKTGEKILRKPATTKTIQTYANSKTTTPFVTTFTLGTEFKYTAVEVVDELPEGAIASRAIYVDNDKYLKITFNKEIRSSKLSIVENSTTTTSVTNYIKGNAVYLPLAKIGNDSAVKVSGTVLSTANEQWTLGTNGFDTLYAVNKLSYKMVKTSLYELKASIASGKNDAIVKKIAPGDTFTFEFDQDVSKAEWTAELYDANNVGVKNLDQTAYVATPAADGKVVTVTLSGKALDFGKVYYLSLKATKRTGDDAVVLYDSSVAKNNGSGTSQNDDSYGPLPGDSTGATLNTGIMVFGNSNKPYIKVETVTKAAAFDNYYVVEESNNSASETTSFDEFKKSNKSKIVLEFSEDVTGFTAVLAKDNLFYSATDTASSASNWLKAEDVLAKNTFASTAEASGKVITITPTDAFPSKSKVYPIVFTKDGDRLPLRKVSDDVDKKEATYLTVATTPATSRVYESAAITFDETTKKADKATNALFEATKVTSFKVSNFDAANVGNGATLYFSFKPYVSANSNTPDYGTYTLYQKKQGINTASTVWKKVGEYKISDSSLKAVDTTKSETVAKGELQSPMVKSVETASAELFAVSELSACISAPADADEFNYAKDKKSYYKVVCAIDNSEIYSDIITVTDAKVYADAKKDDLSGVLGSWDKDNTLTITSIDYANETAWTDNTFKFVSTSYLKEVTATLHKGDIAGDNDKSKNRVGKEATVAVDVVSATASIPAHTQYTVKISPKEGASDTSTIYVAAGDYIEIFAKDGAGASTKYTIKFAKPN